MRRPFNQTQSDAIRGVPAVEASAPQAECARGTRRRRCPPRRSRPRYSADGVGPRAQRRSHRSVPIEKEKTAAGNEDQSGAIGGNHRGVPLRRRRSPLVRDSRAEACSAATPSTPRRRHRRCRHPCRRPCRPCRRPCLLLRRLHGACVPWPPGHRSHGHTQSSISRNQRAIKRNQRAINRNHLGIGRMVEGSIFADELPKPPTGVQTVTERRRPFLRSDDVYEALLSPTNPRGAFEGVGDGGREAHDAARRRQAANSMIGGGAVVSVFD